MNSLSAQQASSFEPRPELSRQYRDALSQFATGVTIITCQSSIGPLGITANSFTSVSVDPALILWCPTKDSNRYEAFMTAKYFAVHVMPVEEKELCLSFARSGQAFDDTRWRLGNHQLPILESCLARFECRYFADYDGGDHSLLLGLVEKVSVFGGSPLTFAQGRFSSPDLTGI